MILKNKLVIITSASTGIGRETAIAFGSQKAHLLLIARTKDRLNQTKKLVEKVGGKADVFTTDLSALVSINHLIDMIKKRYKRIDILCNFAGVWHGQDEVFAGKKFETFSQKVITDTYMVGVVAPSLLTHAFIPLMTKESVIINLSGTFESGAKGWLPYYVSKKAIEDLTVGLAQELKEKRIKVYGISPSDVATEAYKKYFPQYIKDAIDPKEIAKFAVDFCLDGDQNDSGKIFILKKDKKPFVAFHF